jgi:hypothetical protein
VQFPSSGVRVPRPLRMVPLRPASSTVPSVIPRSACRVLGLTRGARRAGRERRPSVRRARAVCSRSGSACPAALFDRSDLAGLDSPSASLQEESRVGDPHVEPLGHCCPPTLRGFAIRLAKRTAGGHTSMDRVGAWSDHRCVARPVDRYGGCLGLGRRHGLRVRCCDCAREDGRGHPRGNAHPASWPQLLRASATRPPSRALTSASPIRLGGRTASLLCLTFCPNRETKQQRVSRFGSTATN